MPNERIPDSGWPAFAKAACLGLLLFSQTYGQGTPGTQEQAVGVTRASEITAERQQKERQLAAETNTRWEDRAIYLRESKLLERFTAGVAGFRVKLGGLASNGGFAAGPEYLRTDLADGAVTFRASAQASLRKFQKYDVELGVPRLATRWLSWNVYAVHHNYPQLQYYGAGQDSEKTGRSDFRLED
ncbi:MAG TPA: hypothetical protein VES20_02760, partial [Bryobacteraceae bacterium]|nr:hypothetical protein [Bryobacteraceae bacterium]